jgi:hypothetical protein
MTINGIAPYKNFQHLLRQFEGDLNLLFLRKGELRQTQLWGDGKVWLYKMTVSKI